MIWVCLDCGARQAAGGRCAACGHDDTLDTRDVKVRELMRDVDDRLARSREGRLRFVGVIVGMASVFGLWCIPRYWDVEAAFRMPVLIDQWVLMALIGFGVMTVLTRVVGKKRFPYLDDQLNVH